MSYRSSYLGLIFGCAMIAGGPVLAAPPAPDYVAKAGASDMYERESSRLVLATTKNAGVRKFAQEMVADHAKSTAEIKAAAAKSGVKPKPPMLEPKQSAMIKTLTATTGVARDRQYVKQQKMAHQEVLALHKDYAATGDKPALKSTAAKIVPVVEHHAHMLGSMPTM